MIYYASRLRPVPERERKVAFRGIGAVDPVAADVERRLVETEVGEEKVVRQLVLVGEYEVVESRLARLQGHLKRHQVSCQTRYAIG